MPGVGGGLRREGEDDVEVGAVEELAASLGELGGAGGALALRAVAVAAGAVALLDLAAEGGGAALLDGAHDAPLQASQGVAATAAVGFAVAGRRRHPPRVGVSRAAPPALGGGRRAWRQVERAGGGADIGAGDLEVARSGGEAAVAEQQLVGAQPRARLEQVRGERMALIPRKQRFLGPTSRFDTAPRNRAARPCARRRRAPPPADPEACAGRRAAGRTALRSAAQADALPDGHPSHAGQPGRVAPGEATGATAVAARDDV